MIRFLCRRWHPAPLLEHQADGSACWVCITCGRSEPYAPPAVNAALLTELAGQAEALKAQRQAIRDSRRRVATWPGW